MDKIIFILLIIFPFGQILRFDNFLLLDFFVFVAAIYAIYYKLPKPKLFTHLNAFLFVLLFGYLVFWAANPSQNLLLGFLYFVRVFAYIYFLVFTYNLKNKPVYIDYLLAISLVSALFGWTQYFLWPDLRSLKYLGWDDHLMRMTGTFLDPTFLALIIIFGIIIAVYKNKTLPTLFLIISLVFTYSRIGYLIAFLFLVFKKKYLAIIVFIFALLISPKNIGEGTTLTRTASGSGKIINYIQTFKIIKTSPLFGVGYNNLCFARNKYVGYEPASSHSCSGADSSLLFLLATGGILGFISFVNVIVRIFLNLNTERFILSVLFCALLIHSIFANSLFYPFTMFYLILLTGVFLRSKVDN